LYGSLSSVQSRSAREAFDVLVELGEIDRASHLTAELLVILAAAHHGAFHRLLAMSAVSGDSSATHDVCRPAATACC
jgi:hypothetical protein